MVEPLVPIPCCPASFPQQTLKRHHHHHHRGCGRCSHRCSDHRLEPCIRFSSSNPQKTDNPSNTYFNYDSSHPPWFLPDVLIARSSGLRSSTKRTRAAISASQTLIPSHVPNHRCKQRPTARKTMTMPHLRLIWPTLLLSNTSRKIAMRFSGMHTFRRHESLTSSASKASMDHPHAPTACRGLPYGKDAGLHHLLQARRPRTSLRSAGLSHLPSII